MMATKTKEKKAPEVARPLVDWEIERRLGVERARPLIERRETLEQKIDQLRVDRELAEEELAFADVQIREVIRLVESIDITPALAMKPYDAGLRACVLALPGANKPEWDRLAADGATDAAITLTLARCFGTSYEISRDGWKMRRDWGFGRAGEVKATLGAQPTIVAEIRRAMKIPLPAKVKPAGKKKTEAKKTATPKPDAKPVAAKSPKTKPTSPPAPAAEEIPGDWLRAARKAMKRAKLDPELVKDEFPWHGWHANGFGPAAAVKAWKAAKLESVAAADQSAGAGKMVEDGEKPAVTKGAKPKKGKKARILEANPSGRVGDTDIQYDTFDLGVGAGEIAAADQTKVMAKGNGSLTAVVAIGTEPTPYAVLRWESEPYDWFRLYPVVPRSKVVPVNMGEPWGGHVCTLDGEEMRLAPFNKGGILVKDEGPDAKPAIAAADHPVDTTEMIDDEPADRDAGKGTPATGMVARVYEVPPPDATDGVIRGHKFLREELADAYAGTVDDVREGRVRKWVVIGEKEYVVSGKSDINHGALTRWHAHPMLPRDAADPEKAEGIVARKAKAAGRPMEWDWLFVTLPNGAVAVLGPKADGLILETAGPKAGK